MSYIDRLGPKSNFAVGIITGIIAGVTLITISIGIYYLTFENNITLSTRYISISSGLGSVLLVGITALYVYETRRMADEMKTSRQQELEFKKQERSGLRRVLLTEVAIIRQATEALIATNSLSTPSDIHKLSDKFRYMTDDDILIPNDEPIEFRPDLIERFPTIVFDANSDEVGNLEPPLVARLLRFYGEVRGLKQTLD